MRYVLLLALCLCASMSFGQDGQAIDIRFEEGSGITGTTGPTGAQGIQGITGATGPAGSTLKVKSEKKVSGDFSGNPKKATVAFVADYTFTAFTDANYSVSIIGDSDGRVWTVESISAGSFVINSNSNSAIMGDVYWVAVKHGEN